MNQRSLAELNAFIDVLETSQVRRLEDGPETSLQLPFFQGFVTRLGRRLPGRVRPLQLQVPSLPAQASENEKETKPRVYIGDHSLLQAVYACICMHMPCMAMLAGTPPGFA